MLDLASFPHLNVHENIAYGLRVARVPKDEIKRRVNEVLELVELTGYNKRAPNQLSGGQQQRVALARALIMEPKVLLMDEPLSNLDAKLREQMRSEIRRIQQYLGITSVYVTHDQIEAMTISDRVVVMNDGRIEQVKIGTPYPVIELNTVLLMHPSEDTLGIALAVLPIDDSSDRCGAFSTLVHAGLHPLV